MQAPSKCLGTYSRLAAVVGRRACHVNPPTLGAKKPVHRTAHCRVNVTAQSVEAPSSTPTNNPEPSYVGPMDTYAVVEIGGHQLVVEEGRWYTVNRLEAPVGSKIQLGRVLALKQDGEFHVGQPYLDDASVEAEILDEMKGPKVIVYKMKPKKHYRRMNGHRQPLTKFLVTKISK